MKYILILVGILVLVAGGHYAYRYVVETPPAFLIELVTNSKPPPPPLPAGDIAPFTAPSGFTATIYARNIAGARVMTRDSRGTMLVSQTKSGQVVALPDMDGDGKADSVKTVLSGLKQPHGITVICTDACTLYVAETGALKSYSYDPETYSATLKATLAELPTGSGHFTRTLLRHPDGERLLVSVGSSCNVCEEPNAMRATVQALTLATNKMTTFAGGLRNTVFMATDPVYGKVWGTDHGRDLIGDDIPPDEVNIIEEGKNFGWPLCYGNKVHDTDFDSRQYFRDPCADTESPHLSLQAHSAALGLAFIPEEGWPEDMRNDLLVAYHGSWNRSEPTGYKVVRFNLDADRNVVGGPIDFLSGFLTTNYTADALGRPVDIMAEPGGMVYISDDHVGAIYKVSLNEIASGPAPKSATLPAVNGN